MTTYKSDAVVAGIMPDFTKAGVVLCRTGTYTTVADAVGSGDTIQMVPIPINAKILAIDLFFTAVAKGCTAVDVGYGGDTDAFMSTVTFTAADCAKWPGGSYDNDAARAVNHTFTANDTIDLLFTSFASQIPTSQKVATMNVYYKMTGSMADET